MNRKMVDGARVVISNRLSMGQPCCCEEGCCSHQIFKSEPSCDLPPPVCDPDDFGQLGCTTGDIDFCLESFTFDEATGMWTVVIETRNSVTLGDPLQSGKSGNVFCLGMIVQGACNLGCGEIQEVYPEPCSVIFPQLGDNCREQIACAFATSGCDYGPGSTIPAGTQVEFRGDTNFEDIVPCDCCTFELQLYLLFDNIFGALQGILIARVEYGETPCLDPPEGELHCEQV